MMGVLLIRLGFDMSCNIKKTSQSQTSARTDEVTVQQQLKQVLAKPARRKLYSLELDTRGFRFNRDEANER